MKPTLIKGILWWFGFTLLAWVALLWLGGCVMTASHYETTITDPNGLIRTVYVHHGTNAFLYDLSKLKVDLKLKDIGSLEVLGSVAEAQKIEDMVPAIIEGYMGGGV